MCDVATHGRPPPDLKVVTSDSSNWVGLSPGNFSCTRARVSLSHSLTHSFFFSRLFCVCTNKATASSQKWPPRKVHSPLTRYPFTELCINSKLDASKSTANMACKPSSAARARSKSELHLAPASGAWFGQPLLDPPILLFAGSFACAADKPAASPPNLM